jgi:hypothetical protein
LLFFASFLKFVQDRATGQHSNRVPETLESKRPRHPAAFSALRLRSLSFSTISGLKMDSAQDFKRTHIPFDLPTKISKTTREILLNDYGKTRTVLDRGVLVIQVKKLKGEKREVLRINTTDIRLTC